jgi:hypothetical protein
VTTEQEDDAGREDAVITASVTDQSKPCIQIGKPRHIGYTGVRGYADLRVFLWNLSKTLKIKAK